MVPRTEDAEAPAVEVRRSRRRRRTVSAYRADDGTVVVLLPARMTKADERRWVTTMVTRLERSEARRRPSDAELARRAGRLSERYLEGLARPESVRWVDNQQQRWGSCTPADKSIRLSRRLQGSPEWVVDYVLLHELAHLLERGHTRTFWRLVDRYPKAERAKGFLEGVAQAMQLEVSGEDVCDPLPEGSADDDLTGDLAVPETVTAEIDQLAQ
jgi:predicted metal-dependent hydrolase